MCQRGYTGLIVGPGARGGFADFVRVPADFCHALPEALPSAHAAPLLCAGVTVYAPLARWLRPGAAAAIVGVGGLGHLALQFAAALGCAPTAVDIDASKAAEARAFRAANFVHLPDFASATHAGGAHASRYDVILNTASATLDTAMLMRALAPGGTLVQARPARAHTYSLTHR